MHLLRTMLTAAALAVIAGAAAAGFLLARRLEGDHHDSDHEEDDEEEDRMPKVPTSKSAARRDSALSVMTRSGSEQKLQKLESAIFNQQYDDDPEAQARLGACLNDHLSPADNAAALLYLLLEDHPELSGPSRAALVYSIKALKAEDNTSTLPSALLEDPSGRPGPGSFKSKSVGQKMTQSFRVISQGIVASEKSRFKRRSSKSFSGGLESPMEGVQSDLRRQNEKELVYSWLRNEYSNYRRSSLSIASGACYIYCEEYEIQETLHVTSIVQSTKSSKRCMYAITMTITIITTIAMTITIAMTVAMYAITKRTLYHP